MTETRVDRGAIEALAVEMEASNRAFEKAFVHFMNGVPLLERDKFFHIAAMYREEIVSFKFRLNRSNGVKQAAWEIFRCAICENPNYNGEELIQFAKTYDTMKSKLYKPLFDVVEGKGDDGYSDLLDNLPLVGQELYEALERKDYGTTRKIQAEIRAELTGMLANRKKPEMLVDKMEKFIWNGENYNGMMLMDACKKNIRMASVDAYLKVNRNDPRFK